MFSMLMDNAVWSMQVLKGEEVVIEKVLKPIFGHSSHRNTKISFAVMHCVVCKFEKGRSNYYRKVLEAIFGSWSSWKC